MGEAAVDAGLTTEHLKSHLQKYRLNYERSKREFLQMYDQSIQESTRQQKITRDPITTAMSTFPICSNEFNTGSIKNSECKTAETSGGQLENSLALQARNLKLQAQYHKQLQQQIQQQRSLQIQIQESLAKLNSASYAPENWRNASDNNSSSSTATAAARGGGSGIRSFPANDPNILQLEMHQAMQSQMNLHRQIMLRKDQVLQQQPLQQQQQQHPMEAPLESIDLLEMEGWGLNVDLPDDDVFGFLRS